MLILLGIIVTIGQVSSFAFQSRGCNRPLWQQRNLLAYYSRYNVITQQIRMNPAMCLSNDEDIEEKLLDNQMIFSLSNLGDEAFDYSSEKLLTAESLLVWEKHVDSLAAELNQLTNKPILLAVYASILKKAAIKELDPLQMATFQLFSNSIMDALVKLHPPTEAITSLIDEVTDVHLDFVDKFQPMIDDGGDDGYSQSARQEYLAYQLAGLVRRTYSRVSRGLGATYDMTASSQDMRITNWVSPVYARLERRFVRFQAGNVEDREMEINSAAFDKLLEKVKLDISPKYSVSGNNPVRQKKPEQIGLEASSLDAPLYPSWELANFVTKLMRNVVVAVDIKGIEQKITFVFQNLIAKKMRLLGKPLEKIYETRQSKLDAKGVKQVEEMLNLGHLTVSAVFTLWQVRHNIVGTPDPAVPNMFVKDYLRRVSLYTQSAAMESIPKYLRQDIGFIVQDFSESLSPSEELAAVAIIGNAVRTTASDELRSLITYNSDESNWPLSRDSAYIAVLSSVLSDALSSPSFDLELLYENSIALVALEEVIGVREPRLACSKGYQAALRNTVLQYVQSGQLEMSDELKERVREIELMLGMVLRLPEGSGKKARMDAFRGAVDGIISNAEQNGRSGFKEVESKYLQVASMLSIDPVMAKAYVSPLGQTKFDKSVGSILMNADLAVSMPEMGDMFRQQIKELAEDVLMTPEQGEERTGFLAAAVFESLMETALEENRRMNSDRAEALLLRAYNMYRHPLLISLQSQAAAALLDPSTSSTAFKGDLVEMGVKMTVARLGTSLVMELMRLLEGVRGRLSSTDMQSSPQGWGSNSPGQSDPKFLQFVQTVQTCFLKEYTAGSLKRGYTKQ